MMECWSLSRGVSFAIYSQGRADPCDVHASGVSGKCNERDYGDSFHDLDMTNEFDAANLRAESAKNVSKIPTVFFVWIILYASPFTLAIYIFVDPPFNMDRIRCRFYDEWKRHH